jgi:hypothetical protein
MNLHVSPNLEFVIIIIFSFDLWMSKGGVDTFASIINYLNAIWKPRHAIVGFFKVHGTIGVPWLCNFNLRSEKLT